MHRGPYARGKQARELILETALAVIAEKGYGATSLRDIAEATGLTQAGILHHFGTKENLLVEVLRARDEVDRRLFPERDLDDYPRVIKFARHNRDVPGLVKLYVALAAAAADPAHPCHEYFVERDRVVHSRIMEDIRARQQAGTFTSHADPDLLARAFLALSDGLQAQWLIDPSIDLPGVLERLWDSYRADAVTAV
ncbi:TetR/AcrR family transcriptional regulator [Okibacterium endophyticum]